MEARIIRFLQRHHVLTLSTCSENGTWTAHCFYAWMPDHQALVFTTDPETRHGREMLLNPKVSGGIMLETNIIGKIRGIQLTGRAFPCQPPESTVGQSLTITPPIPELSPGAAAEARLAYLKRFPFALAVKLDLWILQIDYIKMTDNRLGFGKKLQWTKP